MNGYFDIKLLINNIGDKQEREELIDEITVDQHYWAVKYHGFPVRNGDIIGSPCYAANSWISKEKPDEMTFNDILVYLGRVVKQKRRSIYEQF